MSISLAALKAELRTLKPEAIARLEAGMRIILESPTCTDKGRLYCQTVLDALAVKSGTD